MIATQPERTLVAAAAGLFLAVALATCAPTAKGATVQATPTTLLTVMAKVKGGDTVQLAPGTYTGLQYGFYNMKFTPAVTITSADPARPAQLTTFGVNNAQGLVFVDVELVTASKGYFDFNVWASADIHFDRVSVHGSLDGNPLNDIEGIAFTGSDNVSVTNSEFQQLLRGLSIGSSTHVTVDHNHFHDLEITGMAIGGGSSNVAVTFNTLHDFYPLPGDHPDAIQFLTAGQTGTTHDVAVTDNLIYRGKGSGTQGIFFRDQTTKQHYANVTVARNLIVGTGFGGIAMDYTDGLTVDGNVLVSFAPPADYTPLQVFNSTKVTLSNNAANVWGTDGDTGLTQVGNTTVAPVSDGGGAAMTAFAQAHPAMAAMIAPAVPPPPPPPPDPRDTQIADLTAKLAAATSAQAASAAQIVALNAQVAQAAADLANTASALNSAQAAATAAQSVATQATAAATMATAKALDAAKRLADFIAGLQALVTSASPPS